MSAPLRRGPRTVLTSTGLVAALVLTATACGGSGKDEADDKPDATVSRAAGNAGEVRIPRPACGR
ncbi:hypothetical protein KYY02_25430 [Streptomyces pimonensis]|uniref:Lipoprotein n=1 Tax=Streptomyces pimonensis TaxID=2860288 RepID=A0ABV4J4Q0_9ACTN